MRTKDKPIIASCNMFSSFLIFCCYFTCLKTREISLQNMINSGNIPHIPFGTV